MSESTHVQASRKESDQVVRGAEGCSQPRAQPAADPEESKQNLQ